MADASLLLMRLGYAALLLAFHGGPRFVRAFNFLLTGEPWAFVDLVTQLGLPFAPAFAVASALSESVGPALVAAGLWTRVAASTIAVNMAVATYHEAAKGDPIELPAFYLLGAVVIAIGGAGRFSIDAWRGLRPMPGSYGTATVTTLGTGAASATVSRSAPTSHSGTTN